MAIAYYGTDISPNKTETTEGYLICRNVPIARTGRQEYLAEELRLDGDPYRKVTVDRAPEDVFEDAALASFEGKPVTDGHPTEAVGPENYAAYQKGHVQNVRRDGDFIVADLYINDANLASEIQNGVKREVSCGYLCNYEPQGDIYRQTKIRGNHVAVVPKGRAGATVAIKDAACEAEKGRNHLMNYWKTFLAAFSSAARDAKPEELDGLVETTATALDAEPAEKAPEAEPAKAEDATEDAMTIEAPKGDDIGSKLDRILEMLMAKSRGGEGEHPLHDESDMDDMIDKLSGKSEGEEDKGAALTIPVENSEDACASGPARDAAVELLKKVRPAVASIENKHDRARVTDALLSAVQGKDMMGTITRAALDSAQANAQKTRKTNYEQMCSESEANYASRNPHHKEG
uniref:DUF2213 domain-containing protein n=1 Tax=Siphoviridae sp. ctvok7 TaxID=2827596 RepID=A0A8S5LM16_9CAUD|nr:MAG TPA: hypothetical protein [Siphoviridae sp. ctvok7]